MAWLNGNKSCPEGNARGSLTFSAMLLASALLFLITTVSLYVQDMSSTTAESGGIESISAQSDAASYSLSSMLSSEAVSVSSSGSNITFSLDSANLWNYRNDVGRFKSFAEAYSGPGNLSLGIGSASEAAQPVLYIRPQNITADFTEGSMNFTPNSSSQVAGYVASFRISAPSPSINWTTAPPVVANNSPDALYFRIGVEGAGSGAYNETWLNRTSVNNTLQVKNSNGELQFNITMQGSKMLTTYSVAITAATTIMLNASTPDDYVELGANIINVRLNDGTNATLPVIVHAG